MRIQYRVLWIEDKEEYVKELGPILTDFMNSLGFRLEIVHSVDGNDHKILPKNDFQYDLILVDYNLSDSGTSGTGDEIIKLIRSDSVITEAVFYSSNRSLKPNEILSGVQRISFHLGKTGLPNAIKKIMGLTIRKVQDVNNMRGLVIAEVIDLEIKMKTILKDFFSANFDKTKQEELINKKIKNVTENLEKMKNYTPEKVLDFIEDHHTTDDHCRALLRIIKYTTGMVNEKLSGAKTKKKYLIKMGEELEAMRKEVITLRNIMAHVEEEDKNGVIVLQSKRGGKPLEITSKKCIEIRKVLRAHYDHLEEVAQHFSQKKPK